MANPIKGELDFTAGGQSYRFVIGTYAMAALERRTGKPVTAIFDGSALGMDLMLGIMHSGLLLHHELTEREVAAIMDDLGLERCGEIVTEALKLAFPASKPAPAGRKASKPDPR